MKLVISESIFFVKANGLKQMIGLEMNALASYEGKNTIHNRFN
jgi:hypothetical protein